jgi:hypothetical protein
MDSAWTVTRQTRIMLSAGFFGFYGKMTDSVNFLLKAIRMSEEVGCRDFSKKKKVKPFSKNRTTMDDSHTCHAMADLTVAKFSATVCIIKGPNLNGHFFKNIFLD